jgi:hypothetical protein
MGLFWVLSCVLALNRLACGFVHRSPRSLSSDVLNSYKYIGMSLPDIRMISHINKRGPSRFLKTVSHTCSVTSTSRWAKRRACRYILQPHKIPISRPSIVRPVHVFPLNEIDIKAHNTRKDVLEFASLLHNVSDALSSGQPVLALQFVYQAMGFCLSHNISKYACIRAICIYIYICIYVDMYRHVLGSDLWEFYYAAMLSPKTHGSLHVYIYMYISVYIYIHIYAIG